MRSRLPTFNDAQHRWIRLWHAAMRRKHERPHLPSQLLPLGLGDRARLRRAPTQIDLVSAQATMILAQGLVSRANGRLPKDSGVDYGRLGVVAGVLACVDEDRGEVNKVSEEETERAEPIRETLAVRLGRKAAGGAPMSDLRFRQMRSATNPEELLRLWRRAIHLAKRNANVATLADDLYTWLLELDGEHTSPSRSVRFHWAYDYYQQPRDQDAGRAPTPDAEAEG